MTEPVEDREDSIEAYTVDCPRRGYVGLDVCVACPESGRVRYHRRGKGPITIECSYVKRPNAPKLRLVESEFELLEPSSALLDDRK